MGDIDWSRISLAVWGHGEVPDAFVARVRQRFPGVRIFDRIEELKRQASATHVLSHLEVADIDAVFSREGKVEHAVIRCLGKHRSFNYEPESILRNRTSLDILLKRMLDIIPWLLSPPEPPPRQEEAASEETDESADNNREENGEEEPARQ